MVDLVNMKIKKKLENINEVTKLLANNFPGKYDILKSKFKNLLENIPYGKFITYSVNKKVIGFLLVLKRSIFIGGKVFSVCGMSFMAVDSRHKSLDASTYLKKKLLHISQSHDLTIGFARKVMDGYWSNYGFIGVSSFSQTLLNLKGMKVKKKDSDISFKNISTNDINIINKIYNESYKDITGAFKRDSQLWNYYIIQNNENLRFIKIIKNNKIIGYFFYNKDKVNEVAAKNNNLPLVCDSIIQFFINEKITKISFNLSFNHPLIKLLNKYSHERFLKYIYEGGHLVRINDIKKFLIKYLPLLERQLNILNIKFYDEEFDGIIFSFKNKKLKISYTNNFIDNSESKRNLASYVFSLPNINFNKPLIMKDNKFINFSVADHF